MVLYKLEFVP